MSFFRLIFIIFLTSLVIGCSTSYKELTQLQSKNSIHFQDYLFNEYKIKAIFEAEEMHDWNSAKLYSEKALKSLKTDNIYPQEISYWKIPIENFNEIKIAHNNLNSIYDHTKNTDPQNLAIAIVSLDCWSEQQEENWQIWDINDCKQNFLKAMHTIYKNISEKENMIESENRENKLLSSTLSKTLIKKDNQDLLQIIYFDFDKTELSEVSIETINKFLKENKNSNNQYLIIGHTDTKGSKKYNYDLSIERARVIKNILLKNDIKNSKIKILGKGEESLAVLTPDDTKHPANRRVEIKKSN